MNDRSLAETLVALPAGRLRQGEVNLHLGAAEAKAFPRFGNVGRDIGRIKQAAVELGGSHVADDGPLVFDRVAGCEPDSRRTTALDENAHHVPAGLAIAAVILDQADERI